MTKLHKSCLLGLVGATAILGCSGDTTGGAAESAAEMAKKSENAEPLPPKAQAELDKMKMPGGKK